MHDVIIAGAGPAGSTCARECAREGLKTLLLDKDPFPRSKPCGGAVSSRALSLLDFALHEHLIEKECYGARVHYGGRTVEVQRGYRIAVLVSRDRFDAFLADKAVESEARFAPGEKVVAVHEGDDGVTVVSEKATYQSRFLVGADGIHSRVALAIKPPPAKPELALALVSSVPADDVVVEKHQDSTLDMHFGIAPQGYGWLFPHRGYYSLGMMCFASTIRDPKKVLNDFAHALGMDLAAVQGHYIPRGGIKRRVASKRILLAGDAAGFADPFQGEGIAHAILSGKLAARVIIDSIKENRSAAYAAARYRWNVNSISEKTCWLRSEWQHCLTDIPVSSFASSSIIQRRWSAMWTSPEAGSTTGTFNGGCLPECHGTCFQAVSRRSGWNSCSTSRHDGAGSP